jgi:hypothetical protein
MTRGKQRRKAQGARGRQGAGVWLSGERKKQVQGRRTKEEENEERHLRI